MRTSVPLLALALIAGPALAQEGMPEKPSMTVSVPGFSVSTDILTYETGLRVGLQHDASQPTVGVATVVDVGGGDDPVGKSGMAHLLERLWFRSVHDGLDGEIRDVLRSGMGCSIDATTEHEITMFTSRCPALMADELMAIEGLRLTEPLAGVTAAVVAEEVAYMQGEGRLRMRTHRMPAEELVGYVRADLFPAGHAYHQVPHGSEATQGITLDQLKAFASEHYAPAETTIMVTGAFDSSERAIVFSLVHANLAPELLHPKLTAEHISPPIDRNDNADPDDPEQWFKVAFDPTKPAPKSGPRDLMIPNAVLAPRIDSIKPPPFSRDVSTFTQVVGPVDEPTVLVGWALPPSYQGQDALMHIVAGLVTRVASFRYDDPELAEFKGCHIVPGAISATMVCVSTATSPDARGDRLGRRLVDQLVFIQPADQGALQMDDISRQDMAFRKSQLGTMANGLYGMERLAGVQASRAGDVGRWLHYTGDPLFHATRVSKATQFRLDQVIQFQKEWVTRDRAARVFVVPASSVDVQYTDARPLPKFREQLDPERTFYDRAPIGAAGLAWPTALATPERVASMVEAPDRELVVDGTLPNGLRVVAMEYGRTAMVNMRLVARGGTAEDPSPTQAESFARWFGKPHREDATDVAGDWYGFRDASKHVVGLEVAAGNVDDGLWLLRSAASSFDVSFVGRADWVFERKKEIVSDWHSVDWHIDTMRDAAVNPGHPLTRRFGWDELAASADLGTTEVRDSMLRKWNPSNTTLVLAGNVGAQDLYDAAEVYFGSWRPAESTAAPWATVPGPATSKGRVVAVFDDADMGATDVELTCQLTPGTWGVSAAQDAAGRWARQSLGPVTSAAAGGGTGVVVESTTAIGGTSLLRVAARVPTARAGALVKAWADTLGAPQVTPEAAAQVATLTAAARGMSQTSIREMLGRVSDMVVSGAGWKQFADYGAAAGAVDVATLEATLAPCAGSAFVSVRGPGAAAAASLSAAGVEHTVVDWAAAGAKLHEAADAKGYAKLIKKREKDAAKARK